MTLDPLSGWTAFHTKDGDSFYLGEHVRVRCGDGAWFCGPLTYIDPDFICVNGLGIAIELVQEVTPGALP